MTFLRRVYAGEVPTPGNFSRVSGTTREGGSPAVIQHGVVALEPSAAVRDLPAGQHADVRTRTIVLDDLQEKRDVYVFCGSHQFMEGRVIVNAGELVGDR